MYKTIWRQPHHGTTIINTQNFEILEIFFKKSWRICYNKFSWWQANKISAVGIEFSISRAIDQRCYELPSAVVSSLSLKCWFNYSFIVFVCVTTCIAICETVALQLGFLPFYFHSLSVFLFINCFLQQSTFLRMCSIALSVNTQWCRLIENSAHNNLKFIWLAWLFVVMTRFVNSSHKRMSDLKLLIFTYFR